MRLAQEVSVHGIAGVRGAANPQVGAVIATRSAFARKMYSGRTGRGLGCTSCLGAASAGLTAAPGADTWGAVLMNYGGEALPTIRRALLWAHHRPSDDPSSWAQPYSQEQKNAVETVVAAANRGDRAAQQDVVDSMAYAYAAGVVQAPPGYMQRQADAAAQEKYKKEQAAADAARKLAAEQQAAALKLQQEALALAEKAQKAAATPQLPSILSPSLTPAQSGGIGVGTVAIIGAAALAAFILLRK